jgi:membrane protease YdiL (CAAX protease family)
MEHVPGRHQLVLFAVLLEGGLAVLALGLGWLFGQPAWADLHWDPRDAALGALASLPLLLVFLICTRWPVGPLARIRQFADEVIRPLFAACRLPDLAVISLLAGFGEEMLFRGVIQGVLSRWLGPWTGVPLAGILFGLMHLITLSYAVMAALMGIYLGWVWAASENLLVVIVAHALYDFLALVYLVGTRPGQGLEGGTRQGS